MFFLHHLLGLAGVSRQEEGQKGVSRGDDIFGNGKHQVALPNSANRECSQIYGKRSSSVLPGL